MFALLQVNSSGKGYPCSLGMRHIKEHARTAPVHLTVLAHKRPLPRNSTSLATSFTPTGISSITMASPVKNLNLLPPNDTSQFDIVGYTEILAKGVISKQWQ